MKDPELFTGFVIPKGKGPGVIADILMFLGGLVIWAGIAAVAIGIALRVVQFAFGG